MRAMWGRPRRASPVLLAAAVAGCGLLRPAPRYDEEAFARKRIPVYTIATPRFGETSDTVVGEQRTVVVREGDTMMDIARLHDLGFNEIVDANPGIDPWVPPVGTRLVLPTAFVLPCCTYDGLVVNIPEMRLYYFRSGPRADTTVVQTFPVGLGREEFRTPRGTFRVTGKTVNPTWNVPERIRQEHIRERNDDRRVIPGGHPDNPLGKYRLELDRTLFRIHGTNIPWGVGMLVSHGCIRLYPEDIERLFPLVPLGTRVELTYQPVKVGVRRGTTYVEVHGDVYRVGGSPYAAALEAVRRRRLPADRDALRLAVATPTGVARPVGRGDTRRAGAGR